MILRRARYPLRGSKYANHIYTDHQHVVLLALRQHLRKSYREFCELIEVCTPILDELGLKKVPHWTTLEKFSKRGDTRRLERLLLVFLEEARVRVLYLAVDSTGFSPTSASMYYVRTLERRTGEPGRPRRRRPVRHYLKQTMAVETRKQLIVAVKFRVGPANDSPDFIRVLKKVEPANQSVKLVVADKGYDAERNHEYAQEVLGAETVIPVRAASRPKIKMRGRRRRKMAREIASRGREYHQRVKIETVHSVEKRLMGSHVLARGTCQQHKELIFRAFSYNSRRMEALFLLFIEDFYKAHRMLLAEEVSLVTDILDCFHSDCLVRNVNAFQGFKHHGIHLMIQHELLVGEDSEVLQQTRTGIDVGSGQQHAVAHDGLLICSLLVRYLGARAPATDKDRQFVVL